MKSKPSLGRTDTFQEMLDLEQRNKVDRIRSSSAFSLASTSTPRSPPPPRLNLRENPPVPLPSIDRAITAPTMPLAAPPNKRAVDEPSTKYVVKSSGEVVPQEEEVSDADSDASSICQSPGWEDYNGKKRKKAKQEERERRRKQIAGTNEHGSQIQQSRISDNPSAQTPKRLSKAPPTNKRLTRMSISAERSMSAPAIATLPTMARGDVRKDVKKESRKDVPEKLKRSSIDIGLKGLMTPWKSSQNSSSSTTPAQGAPSSRRSFSTKPGTYNDGGFIGGLKLEQYRQTGTSTSQQTRHEPKKVGWSGWDGEKSVSDRDPTPQGAGISSSSTSMSESVRPISIHDELLRSPQQCDTDYADAARGRDILAKSVEDSTPIMEWNLRNAPKSYPPTLRYHFTPEDEGSGSSQPGSSNGSRNSSLPASRNTEGKIGQNHTQFPVVSQLTSPDHRPTHDRGSRSIGPQRTSDRMSRKPEPQTSKLAAPVRKSYPPEARGLADFERLQRQGEEANASKDESEGSDAAGGSKKGRSRRGSFTSLFSRSRSRTRTPSEAPTTSHISTIGASGPGAKKESPGTTSFSTIGGNRKPAKKDANSSGGFLDEEYVLNQLHLKLNTKASGSTHSGHQRSSSKGPSFQGFKSAAKSAFSRRSVAGTESPTGSFTTAVEFQGSAAKSAFSRHSVAGTESPTGSFTTAVEFQGSASKATSPKRTSIETTSPHTSSLMASDDGAVDLATLPAFHGSAVSYPNSLHRSPARSPARRDNDIERSSRISTPKALNGNNRSNHTRSATDSSEEYSTLDESSNITTPSASRPQSQGDYFSLKGDLHVDTEALVNISSSTLQSSPTQGFQISTPTTDGATLPNDSASFRNSWGTISAELELTRDGGRLKTPTENNFTFDFTSTHMNDSSPQAHQLPLTSPTEASDLHRKPSLSRSISTPELQDLSFLPTLKHQALTRHPKGAGKATPAKQPSKSPKKAVKALVRPPPIAIPATESQGSSPETPQPSRYLHNARLSIPGARSPSNTSFSPGPSHHNGLGPIAKMLVVCCQCKHFHDMPSKIYECMAKPDNVVTDSDLGVSGVISTSVKCPWCGHGMGTSCCAGYAAVVYLREKLH